MDIGKFFDLLTKTNIGTDISHEIFLYKKLKRPNSSFSDRLQTDLNINTRKNMYDSFVLAISSKLTNDLNEINLLEQFLKYGNLINLIMDNYSSYIRKGRYTNYFNKVIKYISTELDPKTVEVTTIIGDGVVDIEPLPKGVSIVVDTGNSSETFISLNLVKILNLGHKIDTSQKIIIQGVCGSGESYGRLTVPFTVRIENINFEHTFDKISISDKCGADILFGQTDFIKELWRSNIAVFGYKDRIV